MRAFRDILNLWDESTVRSWVYGGVDGEEYGVEEIRLEMCGAASDVRSEGKS
jgi:hypothetical protein